MAAIYRTLFQPLVDKVRGGPKPVRGPSSPVGIGLALGGGFSRGFAHLGVLQVLEENQIPISCIAGTSVGSILGTAYASGVPLERIVAICRNIRFRDFGRWQVSRLGLASNARMGELIRRYFHALTFEDLLIPTAVVATDLGTGEPVVFTSGDVVDAVRASCAFPGLFAPVQFGKRYLADGGLVAPVPTKAAAALGAPCVVGVAVGFSNWNGSPPTNLFQVVSRAISASQKHQTEQWESFADILVKPDVQAIEWDEFHRVEEAIAAGAAAARDAVPRLRELLQLPAARSPKPDPEPKASGQFPARAQAG